MVSRLIDYYSRLLVLVLALLMLVLLCTVACQIAGRYVPFIPRFLWTDEVARYTLVWVVFLGAVIGVRTQKHFYVNFLPENLSPVTEKVVRGVYYLLMYLVALIFVFYGFRFFKGGYSQHSQIIGFNLGLVYFAVPFAGLSWIVFLSENLYIDVTAGRGSGT